MRRPPLGVKAITGAEHIQRYRELHRMTKPVDETGPLRRELGEVRQKYVKRRDHKDRPQSSPEQVIQQLSQP